jgi:hypothetical protein
VSASPEVKKDVSTGVAVDIYDKTVEGFTSAVEIMSVLTPRNRYLLMRSLWVMFDLDTEHTKARTSKRSAP